MLVRVFRSVEHFTGTRYAAWGNSTVKGGTPGAAITRMKYLLAAADLVILVFASFETYLVLFGIAMMYTLFYLACYVLTH